MKYCKHCGKEIADEAVVCPNCGCAVDETAVAQTTTAASENGIDLVAKIFLILGCIAEGWMIIPLIWCIPITISVFNKMKNGEPIGTGLKVCALLFVNLIAGICLLCRKEN